MRRKTLAALAALAAMGLAQLAAAAEPLKLLFVGNSFTYTRPPALQ